MRIKKVYEYDTIRFKSDSDSYKKQITINKDQLDNLKNLIEDSLESSGYNKKPLYSVYPTARLFTIFFPNEDSISTMWSKSTIWSKDENIEKQNIFNNIDIVFNGLSIINKSVNSLLYRLKSYEYDILEFGYDKYINMYKLVFKYNEKGMLYD